MQEAQEVVSVSRSCAGVVAVGLGAGRGTVAAAGTPRREGVVAKVAVAKA